jgi:hypothetical protein
MRILRSIQEERPLDDRIREQREAMRRLCEALEAMPAARPGDGLTGRDHDRLIYAQ